MCRFGISSWVIHHKIIQIIADTYLWTILRTVNNPFENFSFWSCKKPFYIVPDPYSSNIKMTQGKIQEVKGSCIITWGVATHNQTVLLSIFSITWPQVNFKKSFVGTLVKVKCTCVWIYHKSKPFLLLLNFIATWNSAYAIFVTERQREISFRCATYLFQVFIPG